MKIENEVEPGNRRHPSQADDGQESVAPARVGGRDRSPSACEAVVVTKNTYRER